MTDWEKYRFEDRTLQILRDAPAPGEQSLGRSFLTSYQIAIEYARRFPVEFTEIGWPVGGQGIGQNFSLSQYVARQLSAKIQDGSLPKVEGGFLSGQNLRELLFNNSGAVVTSSLTGSGWDVAIFRHTT